METTKRKFLPDNVAEHDRYEGGSIMVWGCISLRGRTELHVINNGTLTAQRYRDEILAVHVRPYAGAIGPVSYTHLTLPTIYSV